MGVAFRELPGGRSQLRLPQSRDRALQGSTHYGYCVHGSHLPPMDHDHGNDRTPATRCARHQPVAVSLSNAPPTATSSSVMGRLCRQDAHGPTPPTLSIVMRVRYPGGESGGGKLVPGPKIAVVSSVNSSGAPPSSTRAVPLMDR